MSAKTIAICAVVLSLPHTLAPITCPCSTASRRSPVTANSRAMITIATHADSRSRETSATSAAVISSLSASGSISLPNAVSALRRRAM